MNAKSKALLALIGILAVGLFVMRLGEGEDRSAGILQGGGSAADGGAGEQQPVESAGSEGELVAAVAGRVEAGVGSGPAVAAEGNCVVVGRVLGPDGEPFEGATCQLATKRRWAKDAGVDELPAFGDDRDSGWAGFELVTGADGRFRFDVPIPSASRVELFVAAGPFLSQWTERFGKSKRDQPALTGGVRDLGELRLTSCGSLAGVVQGEDGGSVEDATVYLDPVGKEPASKLTVDGEGRFTAGSLPPGAWLVRATAPGFLDSESLEVRTTVGEELGELRFVLDLAPVVRGRVVTGDLQPVPDALVLATSAAETGSHRTAQARADDAGMFELTLPATHAFQLTCKHPEYRPAEGPTPVAGSSKGVTLLLKPLARVHVRVVDAASGEALERFGIKKIEGGGSKARAPEYRARSMPRVKPVPGGFLEFFGLPERDLLVVAAEGYPLRYADLAGATWQDGITCPTGAGVALSAQGAGVIEQVIQMPRGAALRGRVLAGGEPVGGKVTLTLTPDRSNLFRTLQGGESLVALADAATGVFELPDLTPGVYSVVATGDAGSCTLVSPELQFGETNDVGDLELVASGTILGQVRLPSDIDPEGLFIEVLDLAGIENAKLKEDGSFRMEDVPAGIRTIRQGALRQDMIMGGDTDVNVPAGGSVSTTMDLTSFKIVPVRLLIEVDGEPVGGITAHLTDADLWPERRFGDGTEKHEAYLGKTSAEGLIMAYCRVRGVRMPVLHINQWSVIGHPSERFDLGLAVPIDERIGFETARATVYLPESAALPRDGSLRIRLVSKEDERMRSVVTIGFEDGQIDDGFGVQYDKATRAWQLGRVAPGRWKVSAEIYQSRIAPTRIGQEIQEFGADGGPSAQYSADATLKPGKASSIRLE